ncbi:MAG: LysM peptidoglycan-binding domain-containing protein, partial [Pseudomonadota bacterium]
MPSTARLLVVGLLLVLSGCSGPAVRFAPEDGVHVVRRGETLYSIATAHDMDWREVASRNGIRPPYTLHVGQRLLLAGKTVTQDGAVADPAPKATAKARKEAAPLPPVGKIAWAWPTEGRVVSSFLAGHATRKGI